MSENIKVEEVPNCPLCGRRGVSFYQGVQDRRYGTPWIWSFFYCGRCESLWLNPRPSREELHKYYIKYYTHPGLHRRVESIWLPALRKRIKSVILSQDFGYQHLDDSEADTLFGLLRFVPPLKQRIAFSVRFLSFVKGGRLLDVGCGNGSFLAFMQGLGWEVIGIEPDPEAARIAQEHFGVDVFMGTLEDANLPKGTFDAITMHHVIEHMPDPLSTLRRCFQLLRPRGKLSVVTPSIKSLGHQLFKKSWLAIDPRHLVLFSPSTLRQVVMDVGFHVLFCRTTTRHAGHWVFTAKVAEGTSSSQGAKAVAQGFHILESLVNMIKGDIGEEVYLLAMRDEGRDKL